MKKSLGTRKKLHRFGGSLGVLIPFREIRGKKAGEYVTVIVDPEEQGIYQRLERIERMIREMGNGKVV